jgi:hypothetical protein
MSGSVQEDREKKKSSEEIESYKADEDPLERKTTSESSSHSSTEEAKQNA